MAIEYSIAAKDDDIYAVLANLIETKPTITNGAMRIHEGTVFDVPTIVIEDTTTGTMLVLA